jgi:hypothetical protein
MKFNALRTRAKGLCIAIGKGRIKEQEESKRQSKNIVECPTIHTK